MVVLMLYFVAAWDCRTWLSSIL